MLLNGALLGAARATLTPALNASARVRLAVGVGTGTCHGVVRRGVARALRGAAHRSVGATSSSRRALTSSVTLDGGTVTLPIGHARRRRRLHLARGRVRRRHADRELIADDNTRSTNTAKPVKIRLVHGDDHRRSRTAAHGRLDFSTAPFADSPPHAFVLIEARPTATEVEITNGTAALHRPRYLERTPPSTRSSPWAPAGRRSGPASFAPTADRSSGASSPLHSRPQAPARHLRSRLLDRTARGSVPVISRAPRPADHDRTRQVLRPRRHRGPLGPALGGKRRLRADARPRQALVLHPAAAAERHRHAAHGARLPAHDHGCAGPPSPHEGREHALGAGHRPRRHRHPDRRRAPAPGDRASRATTSGARTSSPRSGTGRRPAARPSPGRCAAWATRSPGSTSTSRWTTGSRPSSPTPSSRSTSRASSTAASGW